MLHPNRTCLEKHQEGFAHTVLPLQNFCLAKIRKVKGLLTSRETEELELAWVSISPEGA